jgi:hypothetical protein
MNKQDLIKEFNNSIAIFERTTAIYQKEYIGFLEEKYIQTENRHQIALGVALERCIRIDELSAESKKRWDLFKKASDLIDEKDEKIKEQAEQIEGLKRQIKA